MKVEVIKTVYEYYDIDDEAMNSLDPKEILDYVMTEPLDSDGHTKIDEVIITNDDGDEVGVLDSTECEDWNE